MTTTMPPDRGSADLEVELERERPNLTGYCYRMLGSLFEAEDAVQETSFRAWRGIDGYEGRASLRSWLFRIATNVCIDALNGRRRRALPMDLGPPSGGDQPPGPSAAEDVWVQPFPDRGLRWSEDPAEATLARESIRLAFVVALQALGPRPRAVLILRDVLAWPATEVAQLLDMSPTAVHSMLIRARQTVAAAAPGPDPRQTSASADPDHRELVARYVDAFERYDITTLVTLLRDDATFSMPPHRLWLRGRDDIGRWLVDHACLGMRMLETRANGRPAVGIYHPDRTGTPRAFGIQVIELSGDSISALHVFIDRRLFPRFGLPAELPPL